GGVSTPMWRRCRWIPPANSFARSMAAISEAEDSADLACDSRPCSVRWWMSSKLLMKAVSVTTQMSSACRIHSADLTHLIRRLDLKCVLEEGFALLAKP